MSARVGPRRARAIDAVALGAALTMAGIGLSAGPVDAGGMPPTVQATPSTGLVTNQVVSVTVTDLPTMSPAWVTVCPANAMSPYDCDIDAAASGNANVDGVFTASVTVRAVFAGDAGEVDCRTSPAACVMAFNPALGQEGPVATTPISFLPAQQQSTTTSTRSPASVTSSTTTRPVAATPRFTG